MEPKSNKSTKSSGGVSNSPKVGGGLSAEEKLKKSLKSLSHTSGGGGGGLNISKPKTTASSKTGTASKTTSRQKVGGVVLDVETIQDATKQKLETRNKRNNVIILVLSLLLVISLIYLTIAIIGFKNSRRDPNCKYSITGSAEAEWIIEGGDKTEFLLKDGLMADHIYLLDSRLNIHSTEEVELTIEIKVKLKGKSLAVAGLKDKNEKLIAVEDVSNTFKYDGTIVGGGEVHLFNGIDFSGAPLDLSSDNITIEVVAIINIV